MGTDDIFKKRKLKKTRQERKLVLIALEDTKSSRYYFEQLIKDKGLTGQVVIADNIGTNPNKVIDALLKYEQENRDEKFEYRWIVIDKDDYSKNEINGAIQRAKNLGICVAISNEAYELWLLLHFQRVTRYLSRVELKRELNNIFKKRFNIDYEKSNKDIYAFIIGMQLDAINNAKSLINHHIKNDEVIDPFNQNPITTIFELVECLNKIYENKECNCFPS